MALTPEEIIARLGEESTNLGAQNRKVDTINIFNGLLLAKLIEVAEDSNKVLRQIRNELKD